MDTAPTEIYTYVPTLSHPTLCRSTPGGRWQGQTPSGGGFSGIRPAPPPAPCKGRIGGGIPPPRGLDRAPNGGQCRPVMPSDSQPPASRAPASKASAPEAVDPPTDPRQERLARADRKSTRLNSSH